MTSLTPFAGAPVPSDVPDLGRLASPPRFRASHGAFAALVSALRASIAIAVLTLTACDQPKTAEPYRDSKLKDGEVALTAVAPDGTRLWSVHVDGRTVYFAASGTQVTVQCGKNCWRTDNTPSVKP